MSLAQVGQKIEFSGTLSTGEKVTNETYQGKPLIVFFFPKSNTPGCTACGISLRDSYSEFEGLGYQIVGVSKDEKALQEKFISKYDFPFPLISDPERHVIDAFGAWGEKRVFGSINMGIIRSTFILDKDSVVTHVIDRVTTKTHAQQLLDIINGTTPVKKPRAAAPAKKTTRKKKQETSSESEEESSSSSDDTVAENNDASGD